MNFFYNVLENAAAVGVVEALKVNKLLPGDDNNQLVQYGKIGALWALTDEGLVALRDKTQSNILNGHYLNFADEVFLNSVLVAGSEKLGVQQIVMDLTEKLPFSGHINNAIATGVVKVGSRLVIEQIPLDSVPYLQYVKHITGLIR